MGIARAWLLSCSVAAAVALAHGTARAQEAQPNVQVQSGVVITTTPAQPVITTTYVAPPPPPVDPRPAVITDWDSDSPVPPGYHVKTRARVGLIVGGSVLFATMYVFTLLAAGISGLVHDAEGTANPDVVLVVPIVGPFIRLPNNDSGAVLILAIDGLAQAAGAAMLIGGIASPKTMLVRDARTDTPRSAGLSVLPVPMLMGKDGLGLGLHASF